MPALLPMAPALPPVPAVDPLPIDPFIEPDCEPGLIVPLVLLSADPFGDCCALLPLALIPPSTWLPGVATIPESDAPLLGVTVDPTAPVPEPDPVPAALVLASPGPTAPVPAAPDWANARPEAASPKHKVVATNKRDMLRTPEYFLLASLGVAANIRSCLPAILR